MSGLLIAVAVFAALAVILYGTSARFIAKGNQRDSLKLTAAWESYYGESQKFPPIKDFTITYTNGDVEKVGGRSITEKEDNFTINDERGKIAACVMKARLRSIKTHRHTYFVNGPTTKETII